MRRPPAETPHKPSRGHARKRSPRQARSPAALSQPMPRLPRPKATSPGAAAGIEYHELVHTPGAPQARVICTDYCPEQFRVQEVQDLAAFLAVHRPEWSKVRWIHVEGLEDREAVRSLAEKYQLHPLAIEDVLGGHHRPKAEDYPGIGELPGRLFVIARRMRIQDEMLQAEQSSFFLGRTTLLSFQAHPYTAIDEVRRRIESPRSRLRENDASFLLYSLLDTVVDRFFPVLDDISERLEEVEETVFENPDREALASVHRIKRDLVLVRRVAWPMRELVTQLQRQPHECLSEVAQTYFRDVQDHCMQAVDLIETYRDIASEIADTHVSMVSNRTNEIMKVLTVIGTIFIPLTFIAGVYGMNMPIPENAWAISYPIFWAVSLSIAGFMLWRFRRGGWI